MVSCHGFDQAALEILMIMRQSDRWQLQPWGFNCLSKDYNGTGCSGADWSCDYKFEKLMIKLGFGTVRNDYWSDAFSSYSR